MNPRKAHRQPVIRTYNLTRLRPWFRFDPETGDVRFGEDSYFLQGDPRPGDMVLIQPQTTAAPNTYRVVKFKRREFDESWVCEAVFAEAH